MKPLILYHDQCADGFCAAWIMWRRFGADADYLPVQYGQEPPDVTDRHVLILDFSYKRPVMERLIASARGVTVLDHHKTAEEELRGLTTAVVKFDREKSGGRLTWEFLHGGKTAPWLVDYTEDRDLWKWKLEESKEVNAGLASYPMNFQEWELLAMDSTVVAAMASDGAAILRYQQQQVDNQVKNAVEITLDDHKILVVNATMLISEIAGQLAKDRPFGACFRIRQDGKKEFSLRSTPDGIDVSEVARKHGGGGHRNAAGFVE